MTLEVYIKKPLSTSNPAQHPSEPSRMRAPYLNLVRSNTGEILVRIPTGNNGKGTILLRLNKHIQRRTGILPYQCLSKRKQLDSIEDQSLPSDDFPYNDQSPGQRLQYAAGEPYLVRDGVKRDPVFV